MAQDAVTAAELRVRLKTAMFYNRTRNGTDLVSGTITSLMAKRLGETPHLTMFNFLSFTDIKIGRELPLYEIGFRGHIYRILVRPTTESDRAETFELIRTKAPGLQSDGCYLEVPNEVPNTPMALVVELQKVLNADVSDIIENAFDILQYRLHNRYAYPNSMEPAGYSLKERYLMSTDTDGSLVTFYETPKGVDTDMWTYFLRALDTSSGPQKLDEYLAYGNVSKDFRVAGAEALRQALRLRMGPSNGRPFAHVRRSFLELFPSNHSETVAHRNISGYRAII